jgi:hypothetical protein
LTTSINTMPMAPPVSSPAKTPTAGGERAFLRQHPADLATRQAEMAQHAELAPSCRRQRGETGGDTGQADATATASSR